MRNISVSPTRLAARRGCSVQLTRPTQSVFRIWTFDSRRIWLLKQSLAECPEHSIQWNGGFAVVAVEKSVVQIVKIRARGDSSFEYRPFKPVVAGCRDK